MTVVRQKSRVPTVNVPRVTPKRFREACYDVEVGSTIFLTEASSG